MLISKRTVIMGDAPLALLGLVAEAHAQAATDVECNGCVDTADIASQAVTTGRIKSQAVTRSKIAPEAVTTAKIGDGAVTVDKVAPELSNAIDTLCAPGETVLGMDVDGNYVCEGNKCEANGGTVVEGGCWFQVPSGMSGNDMCGHPDGYIGPYYSITGTQSAAGCENPDDPMSFAQPCPAVYGGAADKDHALHILYALGQTPTSGCLNGDFCDGDCATNPNGRKCLDQGKYCGCTGAPNECETPKVCLQDYPEKGLFGCGDAPP